MRLFLIAVLLIGLSACTQSRGFDRVHMRSLISTTEVIPDEKVGETQGKQPQLPEPFKLAVYFAPANVPASNQHGWTWQGQDTDQVLRVQQDLASQKIVSEIVSLPDSLVVGEDLAAIRAAAARGGADAVLVVNGVSDVDRYNNSLGPTYALLITPFFVPGTEVDSLFMANASLWDVRNEFRYLSVETEGTAKKTGAAFNLYEQNLIQEAKDHALKGLRSEVSARLKKLHMN